MRLIDWYCVVYCNCRRHLFVSSVSQSFNSNASKLKSSCILHFANWLNFHSASENIWTILSGQATDHTPSIILHDVKEIETWILRLLSAPVPIPGSTRIECELLSASIRESFLFALPDHTRFSLVDFPLHLPLELLGMNINPPVYTCGMRALIRCCRPSLIC